MGGPDMGGLILYRACNGGPGIVRNVPNPARRAKLTHLSERPPKRTWSPPQLRWGPSSVNLYIRK